jgi:drug/metabolite transporter (DMT)-like permease
MDRKLTGYAIMLTTSILWGIGYTFAKICLQVIDPVTLSITRFAFAQIFFIPLLIKFWEKPTKKDVIIIILTGLTGMSIYQVVFLFGLAGLPAGLASILVSTEPIFIYFLAMAFLNEKLSFLKIFGIIVSFIGIIFIYINNISSKLATIAILLVLFASFMWSVYMILSKPMLKKHNPVYVTSFSSLFGTLFLLPLISSSVLELTKMNYLEIVSFIFIVVFSTFLAFYLNLKGLQMLPTSNAAVFYYISPIFTVVSAYFLINEAITANMIIGGILVIGGVAITSKT